MDFPRKIYLFSEYVFLNYLRCCNPHLKTLFFIDNTSPLALSLIARAAPGENSASATVLELLKMMAAQ